ncbi:unnamed protein product [Mycena citricolor]|uniref:F-box domain-containing protein n=1 Tax=Mycena citricolor TaxID=2018698 RepID=A0AAD2HN89_9AGAR|nr:unnamed protein product [Mycena citricolor]
MKPDVLAVQVTSNKEGKPPSAVYSLPPEILAEIFIACVPSVREEIHRRRIDYDSAPWVLVRVCRRWRHVALETPPLWSQIVIHEGNPPMPLQYERGGYYSTQASREALTTLNPLPALQFLAERGTRFRIRARFSPDRWPAQAFLHDGQRAVFDAVCGLFSRWGDVSLEICPELVYRLLELRGPAPLLTRLHLRIEDLMDDDVDEAAARTEREIARVFEPATALRNLSVLCWTIYPPIGIAHGHRLTRYQAQGTWKQHEPIVQLLINVVELSLDVTEPPMDPPHTVIFLPKLKRLHLSTWACLDHITTPALAALSLGHNYSPADAPQLLSLVARSECSESLHSVSTSFPSLNDMEVLACLPHVTHLGFVFPKVDIGFILPTCRFLHVREADAAGPVLPAMTSLLVSWPYDAVHAPIIAAIESRWRSPHCHLRSVVLLYTAERAMPDEVREALETLRSEGLDLRLIFGESAREMTLQLAFIEVFP